MNEAEIRKFLPEDNDIVILHKDNGQTYLYFYYRDSGALNLYTSFDFAPNLLGEMLREILNGEMCTVVELDYFLYTGAWRLCGGKPHLVKLRMMSVDPGDDLYEKVEEVLRRARFLSRLEQKG